jgi:putative transcriptional regulator
VESAQVKNCLAELREEKGWSQGDLAEQLGVSRQTVNALERGKYDPSLPLAFKIARLFKRPIEEIFEPDDKPIKSTKPSK